MDTPDPLKVAVDFAFLRYEEAHGDLKALPTPLQVLIIIYSAQGVIDNGGFQYFFESDWPGTPEYSLFSDAYRAIGALEVADALDKAVAMFPFANPQCDAAARDSFITALPEDHPFFMLDDVACGNEIVFPCLSRYVQQHQKNFSAA